MAPAQALQPRHLHEPCVSNTPDHALSRLFLTRTNPHSLSLSFQHPALTSIFNNVQRIDCSYCLSLRFHFFFFPHPTNDLHNLAADLPSRFQNFQYISPPPINMCKGIQKSYSCGCSQPTQTYYRCPDRKRTKTICPGNDPDDDMVMRVDICLNCMEKNDWAA